MDVRRVVEAVGRATAGLDDSGAVRAAALEVFRRHLGFDGFVWVLTDPVTEVGSAPFAEIPAFEVLPEVIRLKYVDAPNRWTDLGSVSGLGDPDPASGAAWRALLRRYHIADVASAVHRDRFGTWAFLDLWRSGGAFAPSELSVLEGAGPVLTRALRRSQASTMSRPARVGAREGSVIVLVDDRLHVVGDTAAATAWLARLLPPRGPAPPVPAVVYNVAAQLLAREAGADDHPAYARAHLGGGSWISVRAARVQGVGAPGLVGVSLEEASPAERLEVYVRAHGLSERERELVGLLAQGNATVEVAERMFLSPHTVQDHLKSVFAKTGTRSRRVLLARALGVSSPG